MVSKQRVVVLFAMDIQMDGEIVVVVHTVIDTHRSVVFITHVVVVPNHRRCGRFDGRTARDPLVMLPFALRSCEPLQTEMAL
tara:strand:+ start:702 stop:947 length:246 start_codon:yes stop_codon:yes gene_type:complete